MKEYATLVVSDVSERYAYPVFSRRDAVREAVPTGEDSVIQRLMILGWEVIDASVLPKLSTHDDAPRFAFMLEREIPEAKT